MPAQNAEDGSVPASSGVRPANSGKNGSTETGKADALTDCALRNDALKRLLKFEDEVREAGSENNLIYFIANKTDVVLSARQTIVCRVGNRRPDEARKHGDKSPQLDIAEVVAISSLGVVDRNSPKVHWFEQLVTRHAASEDAAKPMQFMASAYSDGDDKDAESYPYPWMLWLPLVNREGEIFAAVLLAREVIWHQAEIDLAARISRTYGHAWQAFSPRKPAWIRHLWSTPYNLVVRTFIVLFLLVFAAIPVRLSALAPLETVAADPKIIAAPMQGVIKDIMVAPSTAVTKGDALVQFEDTSVRNDYQIAEKKVRVAEARLRKAADGAFDDARSKHDYGIAKSELALARAERDYAAALLANSVIRAPADGIAIYGNKKDWLGQPVATGEKIMQLATPDRFEFRIDLPVKDAIVLKPGADVSVFLDSDPLHTLEATLVQVSYEAVVTAENVLAYRIFARLKDPGTAKVAARIGHHGTAKVYGSQVPMIFYLLRRPITAVRQYFGI